MSTPHLTKPTLPPAAQRMNSLTEYFFALAVKKISVLKSQNREVINLGIGSPDLPPSEAVIAELHRRAQQPDQHVYPSYYGLPELNQALAEWYQQQYGIKLDPKKAILPTAGSKESIVFTTLALAGAGEAVIVPNPGYSTYSRAAAIAGAEVIEYELNEQNHYFPDLKKLEKHDLSRVKFMWINYPHNPTGATVTLKQLTSLVRFAEKHNFYLVSDHPYSHITFDGYKSPSVLQVPGALDRCIELNSFSKTYNMAGWRLGWTAGNEKVMHDLITIYSNIETGIFYPIQWAGVAALQTPQSWIDERNQVYADRRATVCRLLEKLNCRVVPSSASLYVWAKLPAKIKNANDYCFDLVDQTGVFLTPGTAFGSAGEGYVRVAICQPKKILERAIELVEKNLS